MIDTDAADVIAGALGTEELQKMTPEELGELAIIFYENDPDVEFIDLTFTPDAGAELHGVNTEEEMMHTLEDV